MSDAHPRRDATPRLASAARLKVRIGVAFLALGVLLGGTFAVAASYILGQVDARYVERAIAENLDMVIAERERNPGSLLPFTSTMRMYAYSPQALVDVPDWIAPLVPGESELSRDGRILHVVVRDHGPTRFALVLDVTSIEALEDGMETALYAGIALSGAVAFGVGLWAAGRIVAPLTRLADAVRGAGEGGVPLVLPGHHDDEVGDLARAFEQYTRRIAMFVERERAFTTDASHELRTPVMSASSALDLLLSNTDLDAPTRDTLRRLRRAIDRMSELIDAFLLLSREPEATDEDAALDVERIARQVLERLEHLAAHMGVTLELQCDVRPQIPGQSTAMSVVLGNLVENAIKHAGASRVQVRVLASAVQVHDAGRGIDADTRHQIFQRGVRGHDPDSDGFGLGLAIAKRLCVHQGWRLTLESDPGQGTLATLNLVPANTFNREADSG